LRLVVATRNPGKLAEFADLLDGLDIDLRSLADFPGTPIVAEDSDSYVGNAMAKARLIAQHVGWPALGDDSGLEVDALGGRPGPRSARFAGEPTDDRRNIEKLLHLLDGVPDAARTAHFRCALVVARPDGQTLTAEGICDGCIARVPTGSAGFGYDPVFLVPEIGRTFAQLDAAEKHRLGHRGQAIARLRTRLVAFLRASEVS
jgi:XTP/dITP diphosphohydrolase